MDPWFEDSMSSKHIWRIGDKDERSAHAKISTQLLADPNMKNKGYRA